MFRSRAERQQPGAESSLAGKQRCSSDNGSRPERSGRWRCGEIGSAMTAEWAFSEKGASIVNRLFYAIGCGFVVFDNISQDVEYRLLQER
jgi:hypothetical protein